MRTLLLLCFCISLLACTQQQSEKNHEQSEKEHEDIYSSIEFPQFQSILDSAQVEGSILILDLHDKKFYSNNFDWASEGRLPASTFKIANSIIALESGVVEDDSTLFPWNGQPRRMKIWEKDLIFKQAFHVSCVPCYQEVARNIGVGRMREYLNKFNYGDMKVDSNSIDVFWLEGESQISQYQQIEFLKNFYQDELAISARTKSIMSKLMVIEKNDEYILSGKTGWSIRNGHNNGWFVGYIEYKSKMYFFATNVSPQEEFNMKMFPVIRKNVTFKALEHLRSESSSAIN
ncbi:MAG: class D beta-lactamase [Bacteroidia bacterium]